MQYLKIRQLNKRGDTIVEVLFAITILAVVISGAYAIANKSLTVNRMNNERNQALKLAEVQIESVKSKASLSASKADFVTYKNQFTSSSKACLLAGGSIKTGNDCKVNSLYTLSTVYNQSGSDETTGYFVSKVTWDEDAADPKTVELLYRVYAEDKVVSANAPTSSSTPSVPTNPLDSCSSSGSVSYSGNYKIHVFAATGSNTFIATCNLTVDYLIIGGGGGGGAGGYIEGSSRAVSSGTYPIIVGGGGVSTSDTHASPSNGGNSSVFGLIAYGGGGGASCWKDAGFSIPGSGANGGSGGGGSGCNANGSGGSATQVAPGFGNAGGIGQWTGGGTGSCNGNGGGGGGAGSAGQSGAVRAGSCSGAGSVGGGGAGKTSSITGNSVTYAVGGNGGAGRSKANGVAGANNTGNGGAGSSGNDQGTAYTSGKGGSGIIIIRYLIK